MLVFKKITLILALAFFFSGYSLVQAEVVINEVQLSPTAERFLELHNTGSSVINLTDWYIQRKTATGDTFNSLVSKPNFENKTIDPNSYFVISRSSLSSSDVVLSTLTLTESNTIQIKNSDEEVVDIVGWGDASICDATCASNPPDGQSIQKVTAGWKVAVPTPGTTNNDDTPPLEDEDSDPGPVVSSGGGGSSPIVEKVNIEVEIIAKALAFTGLPVSFKIRTQGINGRQLFYGKYFWNFGDGDFMEIKANKSNFTHTYFYPGNYDVSLEYYMNDYLENPSAVDRFTISVISPDIVISSVGDEKDFFIEITNNTNHDANLSQWVLLSNSTSFTLPKNTILNSKKSLILSPRITHFSIEDKDTLKLITPQGKVVYDYFKSSVSSIASSKVTEKNIVQPSVSISQSPPVVEVAEETPVLDKKVLADNLVASPILSETKEDSSSFYIYILALFLFLSISSSAVYFIRRGKTTIVPGDDFELIDE